MNQIALTIVSNVHDESAEFVEVGVADVRTPARDMKVGVMVTRAGVDPWLTEDGWGPQPPTVNLPIAIGTKPGTRPLLLLLPRAWARHITPYEVIKISCPALNFEGVAAWDWLGDTMPVDRYVEEPEQRESKPPPPPPKTEIPQTEPPKTEPPKVEPPIPGPGPGPGPGGEPPPPKRWWIWLLIALAVLVAAGVIAFMLTRPKPIPVPVPDAGELFADANDALANGSCDGGGALMRQAATLGWAAAHLAIAEAADPTLPEVLNSCLADKGNMEVALHHYAEACKAGSTEAPGRLAQLAPWIEDAATKDGIYQIPAMVARSAIPAAKQACGLQ